MEGLFKLFICVILILTCAFCEQIEIKAYEYLRRFNKTLSIGQCASRIVQFPEGQFVERCTFPNRSGVITDRLKEVDSQNLIAIHDVSELIHYVGMCSDQSAAYFGLLAKGDCLASEVASKMTFKPKTAVWLHKEHFRPRLVRLKPSAELGNVPDEFTHYLDNIFYTEYIGMGTEELIIVEMQFRSKAAAKKAYAGSHTKMSQKLLSLSQSAEQPRKVKVTRISSSDKTFETEVFKGKFAVLKAARHVEKCERHISEIKKELTQGRRISHVKYGFKAYEIDRPYAAPLVSDQPHNTGSTFTEEDRRRKNWEVAAILQVEAKRTYSTRKRYRKICRAKMRKQKYCLLVKQTLQDLKEAISRIHKQRRDWIDLSYYHQSLFIAKEKQKLKITKDKIKWLAMILKTFVNKKSKS